MDPYTECKFHLPNGDVFYREIYNDLIHPDLIVYKSEGSPYLFLSVSAMTPRVKYIFAEVSEDKTEVWLERV